MTFVLIHSIIILAGGIIENKLKAKPYTKDTILSFAEKMNNMKIDQLSKIGSFDKELMKDWKPKAYKKLKNKDIYVKFYTTKNCKDTEIAYNFAEKNENLENLLYLIENDEKHSDLLVKVFNRYVEFEKISKKICIKEPKETFEENENKKIIFAQHFCDYVYVETEFDGFILKNKIPEFWKSYMTLLLEKRNDQYKSQNVDSFLNDMEQTPTFKEIALERHIKMLKRKNTLDELKEEM